MTLQQAEAAIQMGRRTAAETACDVLLCGEMGIGNTTAATALLCAYSGCEVSAVTGPGAGLDTAGVQHKTAVIEKALSLHQAATPLSVAAAFGGFEILAIAGVILEAHARRVPVLLDGFISCSAALIVQAMQPAALGSVVYAHRSAEPGHQRMLDFLTARPLFELDMRLGEGTGAALAFGLFQSACRLYHQMATFSAAGVSTTSPTLE
jgi:nicotinate-nucleotide--dimethylbenzimidazole phosphoribosyltransferase